RPSLRHPTLELRAPDCCTLVEDSIAIAALYRTLVRHLYYNPWRNFGINAVSRAIVVENKWRGRGAGGAARLADPGGRRGAGGRDARPGDRGDRRRRRGARLR